jgi:uncharacterized protein (DUF1015 family)
MAQRVAAPPYDTLSTAEARELAAHEPWSLLHVSRPEIDLPDGADPHAPQAYAAAAAAFRRMIDAGVLVHESGEHVFVYRQSLAEHVQTGVFACCHVADYASGAVRVHEKTRADKEEDRTRHILALRAQIGPALLTYRDSARVRALVAAAIVGAPLLEVTSPDGAVHAVWRVADSQSLVAAFHEVPCAYIADGHHRCAAAVRAARELASSDSTRSPDAAHQWFMAVMFPASELRIMPYNRCVRDLNGLSREAFLAAVGRRFRVTADATPAPAAPCHAGMYLGGRWYGLQWDPARDTGPLASLDVSRLQDDLLAPVLGIADPRTSARIEFVGGIRGVGELARRVDHGEMAVAFALFPVTVDQMMAIADCGGIMPPKSTWFEPKLRSGLLIHAF